jgi:hypothetical protein
MTAAQFDALFKTEDDCKAYLVARRWPQGVFCPRCGNASVYELHTRAWHWQCTQCAPGGNTGYRFSSLTGTIFENTNKPLKDWFRVAHLMLVSKKGMSALQIFRYMGFGSYKTAWLMCHKIRTAMVEDIRQLAGIVEVDETVVGGDSGNHWNKRAGKGNKDGKTIIVGAVRRKGNIVARIIENVKGSTLAAFVNEAVSHKSRCFAPMTGLAILDSRNRVTRTASLIIGRTSMLMARFIRKPFRGFWSILKRGIVGTFHKVSKKYLHLYVAEVQFRYNNREERRHLRSSNRGC